MAAIGEQFSDVCVMKDDVYGLSISPREKDDLIQIWNIQSEAAEQAKVLDKVHELLPDVKFPAEFYKRETYFFAAVLSFLLCANLEWSELLKFPSFFQLI